MSSSDPLLELLAPKLKAQKTADSSSSSSDVKEAPPAAPTNPLYSSYLSRLASLPLSSILNTEPAALQTSSQSLNVSIQSLSSRSHNALISSSRHLSTLSESVDTVKRSCVVLSAKTITPGSKSILSLDNTIQTFIQKFQKDAPAITDRSKAHLLSRNLDRILDILELPTLLSSSISSGNYPTSLDIFSHVRRLVTLYPTSSVILSMSRECEALQRTMVSNLISSLTGSIKLPVAMKTIGWLKRAVPEMNDNVDIARGIFLTCRLSWVETLFQALEPLRELADEEKDQRLRRQKRSMAGAPPLERSNSSRRRAGEGATSTSTGQHTERYLKRWIEIFREQSFAVVSMYRSIFPNTNSSQSLQPSSTLLVPGGSPEPSSSPLPSPSSFITRNSFFTTDDPDDVENGTPPSPLSTFILHLIALLETTLKTYLPNIQDKSARESLLTQVLYAAGSLGRLGGDFSGIVACLGQDWGEEEQAKEQEISGDEVEEWVEVMKKHKVLASRLEQLAAGGGR